MTSLGLMALSTLMPSAGTLKVSVPLRLLSVGSFVYSLFLGVTGGYALASNRFKNLQGVYLSLAMIVQILTTMLDLVSAASYNRYIYTLIDLY